MIKTKVSKQYNRYIDYYIGDSRLSESEQLKQEVANQREWLERQLRNARDKKEGRIINRFA